jgi:putative endonuclease
VKVAASLPVHLQRGRRGENLAYRHLRKLGYTVVARNYRPRNGSGEVDLIAWDGPQLVFVEVKTRSREEFGSPESAVDAEKRRHILRAAEDYMRRAGHERACARFDTVSVMLHEPPEVTLQKDAFSMRAAAAAGQLVKKRGLPVA